MDKLSEAEYRELAYGGEFKISGTIEDIAGMKMLQLRDAKHVPANTVTRSATVPENIERVVIELSRGECYGTCPGYTITIRGDGTVTYEGFAYVAVCGVNISNISREKVMELIAIFQAADYNSLRDEYTEINSNDSPYYSTSFTVDSKTKKVTHYTGDNSSPTKLSMLEDRIDEIVNSSQWVGTEKYSYGDTCDRRATPTSTP